MSDLGPEPLAEAGYGTLDETRAGEVGPAARVWWDANAAEYEAEHGAFLGDSDLCWGPEGLREHEARLLGSPGSLVGARVLEVGCGAAQGARWATTAGVRAIGTDVSGGMLAAARRADARSGVRVPVVQADARALPFVSGAFDVVFTAYGAIPFVPDAVSVHREAARVLRPGGRWVFSVTHPVRWAFPDDPGAGGLTVTRSYFDRRPYVERGASGAVLYAEFHRTLGDHVRDLRAAGFHLLDLVEPEWPPGHDGVWGGWSPERGAVLPGTAIFVCELSGS